MRFLVIGHNKDGLLRYIQVSYAQGASCMGITADRSKASIFETWSAAGEVIRAAGDTWDFYWRVKDASIGSANQ